ncbi:MAK10-like protein [Tanacetum coccineum]
MGDEIPRRTLGDYSRPSHEGYQTPLNSPMGIMWCLFDSTPSDQASNWLERLPVRFISTWEDLTTRFLAQLIPPGRTSKLRNDILMFQQHKAAGGKLSDKSAKESWALLEDLALYDNESWSDQRDSAKPVKAISMPQDVPIKKEERPRDEPPREHEGPTDIKNLEPSWVNNEIGDEEVRKNKEVGKEGEWLDIRGPLDLVDTCEESVYESRPRKCLDVR